MYKRDYKNDKYMAIKYLLTQNLSILEMYPVNALYIRLISYVSNKKRIYHKMNL